MKAIPKTSRLAVSVEPLEARALLSGLTYTLTPHQPTAEVRAIGMTAHHSGTARKAPAFYEFYTGPRNRDLNVVSATARLLPGKVLTLTGVIQGKINKAPSGTDQQSYFVFGIDRQSPLALTPFFQRPGITFDAVVVVSVETGGFKASVTDLTTFKTTALDPGTVRISGRTVTVQVNPTLLPTPAGGVDLSQASFNLWPRSSLSNAAQPNHGSFVASFVPENATARIGVVGGRHRQ